MSSYQVVVVAVGLMAGAAHAATFTESTSANAQAGSQTITKSPATVTDSYSGSVPKSTLTSNPGNTSSLRYSEANNIACVGQTCGDSWAYSSADTGALHVATETHSGLNVSGPSSSNGNYYTTSASANATSTAQAVDSFVIRAKDVGAGKHGWLTYEFDVDGSIRSSGVNHGQSAAEAKLLLSAHAQVASTVGSSYWQGNLFYDDADTRSAVSIIDNSSDGGLSNGIHQFKVPVVIGSTVTIDLWMQTQSITTEGSGCDPIGSHLVCHDTYVTGTVDYSHTMRWGGIVSLTDDQGNAITDFSALSADTGFDYVNAAVPEPATVALLGSGVMVLLAASRKSQRPPLSS